MQTRTRAGLGFNAGVKDYRLTYYMDDYKVMETEGLLGLHNAGWHVQLQASVIFGWSRNPS